MWIVFSFEFPIGARSEIRFCRASCCWMNFFGCRKTCGCVYCGCSCCCCCCCIWDSLWYQRTMSSEDFRCCGKQCVTISANMEVIKCPHTCHWVLSIGAVLSNIISMKDWSCLECVVIFITVSNSTGNTHGGFGLHLCKFVLLSWPAEVQGSLEVLRGSCPASTKKFREH